MSDQNPSDPGNDKALAGEYALGLLPSDEAAAFEARLVAEPDLRVLYAAWAEDFAGLTDDIAPVAPPASLQRAVEARLFGLAPRQSFFERFGLGWLSGAVAAAVVAVAVFFSIGVLDQGPTAPANPAYVAEIAAEDGSLIVAAAYDAESGALHIDRSVGGPASGRALELWLVAGENEVISLGVLPTDRQGVLTVAVELRVKLDGAVLAISDEPPGGSPTGVATGPIVAIGPITNT